MSGFTFQIDIHVLIQSALFVSSIPSRDEVNLLNPHIIKFASDLWQVNEFFARDIEYRPRH